MGDLLAWTLGLLSWLASGQVFASASDPLLGDLALQKVLDEGAPVFGNYYIASPFSSNFSFSAPPTATWMKTYPDSTPLLALNIPGTHESATWNFSDTTRMSLPADNGTTLPAAYYRCQNASLAASLDAGIRFFDLRFALDPAQARLVFWHSNALMSPLATVDDVLFGFYAWLAAHPSEAVLLSFQYEGSTQAGASDDAAVQTLLFAALTSPAAQQYILQTHDALGMLGAARGKIVLFRRFDLDALPPAYEAALPGLHFPPAQWTDDAADFSIVYDAATNATAFIEDYYEPDDLPVTAGANLTITYKYNATTAHLTKATQAQYADSLFITFASAERVLGDPPVFPETVALGNGSDSGVNQLLVPFLGTLKGKRLGIVVLDYYGEPPGLVEAILGW